MTEAFIYEAIRTPRGRGKANGSLHGVKPVSLVTGLIDEMRTRHPDLDTDQVDDLILGCLTPLGDQGANIAKTAAIAAGPRFVAAGSPWAVSTPPPCHPSADRCRRPTP